MPKKIHFVSLGCPKNRVDTEVMVGVATGEKGFVLTDDAEDAEVIVVNTCGFIGEAKRESIETIFELAELKKVGACKKLVVDDVLDGKKFLSLAISEAFAGSDVAGLRCKATLSEDKKFWIVTGTKKWITNGHFSDFFAVRILLLQCSFHYSLTYDKNLPPSIRRHAIPAKASR